MPRRQVDDQPADLAFPHRGQLRGDDLEMPVHRELSLWIEILEAASCEGHEVVPQQDVILGWCQRLHSSDSRIREPRPELLEHPLVRLTELGSFGRYRFGLAFDVAHNVEKDLDGAKIGGGGAVDELCDNRFSFADLATPAILRDGDGLIEFVAQQRVEALRAARPAARIAGPALHETGRARR